MCLLLRATNDQVELKIEIDPFSVFCRKKYLHSTEKSVRKLRRGVFFGRLASDFAEPIPVNPFGLDCYKWRNVNLAR